jgi:hypothetical protein
VAKPRPSLLVALPSYDGRRYNAQAMASLLQIRNVDVRTYEVHGSLLALNCNRAWAEALNSRPTFFMMIHDDILPVEDNWISLMFQELLDRRASVLSVVSPIKTPDGLTSTAIETEDSWNPRRLSMTEVFERPETWTEDGLLLNTGLMLVNFTEPWVERVHFTINDQIIHRDGKWVPEAQPEDWNFSRMARERGARLYATRKVIIQHVGRAGYDNSMAWGSQLTDPLHAKQEVTA